MIKTIIGLKKEISEQHYHDKGKPVYAVIDGQRYHIDSVNEYDYEVLIPLVKTAECEAQLENGETMYAEENK